MNGHETYVLMKRILTSFHQSSSKHFSFLMSDYGYKPGKEKPFGPCLELLSKTWLITLLPIYDTHTHLNGKNQSISLLYSAHRGEIEFFISKMDTKKKKKYYFYSMAELMYYKGKYHELWWYFGMDEISIDKNLEQIAYLLKEYCRDIIEREDQALIDALEASSQELSDKIEGRKIHLMPWGIEERSIT